MSFELPDGKIARTLPEQVQKNKEDIEYLKNLPRMEVVIVDTLPDEGVVNRIYLVPSQDPESENVYEEFLWVIDEETQEGSWEKIGTTSIDLSNYVDLDSEQTITGKKIFDRRVWFPDDGGYISVGNSDEIQISKTETKFDGKVRPWSPNTFDLGDSTYTWKNLYLSGASYVGSKSAVKEVGTNLVLSYDGANIFYIGSTYVQSNKTFIPSSTNNYDLGATAGYWRDLYLSRNLTDGINSVSVANIASKGNTLVASGTFVSGSISVDKSLFTDGLYFFVYSNAQAFMYITASMIAATPQAPLRVAMPMIYNANGNARIATLRIELNSLDPTKLIISVKDQNDWVHDGLSIYIYKTNLA